MGTVPADSISQLVNVFLPNWVDFVACTQAETVLGVKRAHLALCYRPPLLRTSVLYRPSQKPWLLESHFRFWFRSMDSSRSHMMLEASIVLANHVIATLPAFPWINPYPATEPLPQLSPPSTTRTSMHMVSLASGPSEACYTRLPVELQFSLPAKFRGGTAIPEQSLRDKEPEWDSCLRKTRTNAV